MALETNRKSSMKNRLLKIYFAIGLAFTFSFPFPAFADDPGKGIPPGVASNPLDASTPPAVGNINGIKIAIPHYYLLSGVQYEGEEPLMMKPRKFIPTYDSKI